MQLSLACPLLVHYAFMKCTSPPPLRRETRSCPERVFTQVSKGTANPHPGLLILLGFFHFGHRLALCKTFASLSLLMGREEQDVSAASRR